MQRILAQGESAPWRKAVCTFVNGSTEQELEDQAHRELLDSSASELSETLAELKNATERVKSSLPSLRARRQETQERLEGETRAAGNGSSDSGGFSQSASPVDGDGMGGATAGRRK